MRGTDLSLYGDRSVNSGVHAKDGRLRRVDDGGSKHRPKHSSIGDGECPSIHVLNRQSPITSLHQKEVAGTTLNTLNRREYTGSESVVLISN